MEKVVSTHVQSDSIASHGRCDQKMAALTSPEQALVLTSKGTYSLHFCLGLQSGLQEAKDNYYYHIPKVVFTAKLEESNAWLDCVTFFKFT